MKRFAPLVFALLLAGVPARAQTPKEIGPELKQALRAAKTVRVEVQQDYSFREEPAAEEEAKSGESKPKTEPTKKFSLPLEELAAGAIKLTGWKLAQGDEAAEVVLMIETSGLPRGADYMGTIAGYHYTGAELSGMVRLVVGTREVLTAEISAKVPVATSISHNYYRPEDAPFASTLPEYCEAVFTVLSRVWGPEPLVAAIRQDNQDARYGAERALLLAGDDSLVPALRQLLGLEAEDVRDTAILGLGAWGGAAELEPLLEALRTQAAPAGDEASLEYRRSWVAVDLLKEAPADRGMVAHRMQSEGRDSREKLLWALLQIDAPEKSRRLLAALRDDKAVSLRLSAAILLGLMREPGAKDALRATLRDLEPAVRAAAARALADFDDENVTQALLDLTADADLLVRDQARVALEPAQERHWKAHIAKLPRASTPGAVQSLVRAMQSDDVLVRAQGLETAHYSSEPEIVAAIRRLAEHDPFVFLRSAALQTLGEQADETNTATLVAALRDPDRGVRHQALRLLAGEAMAGEEKTPLPETALEPALALLRERPGADPEQALAVLKRIEGPRTLPAWRELARDSGSPSVRREAVEVLARKKDATAVTLLTGLVADDKAESVRLAAANALGQLDNAAALDPLFALLKSKFTDNQRLAALALGQMRQARAIGPLIAALQAGERASNGEPGAMKAALETLTGKNFASGDEWLRWWKENSGKPFVLPPRKVPEEEPAIIKPGEEPAETPAAPKKD